MQDIQLSLCMIVKDEEDCIARCLKSVADVVDEIIVVDTGSTDRTIEICKSFQAKIEKFKWNGSFADARNYSIKKASGDWILWLDADEELDKKDAMKLHEGNHFQSFDIITLQLINYYGDKVDKNNSTDISHTRLFRNNGIKFINKMHECLDSADIPAEKIGHLDVKVHHYGYLNTVKKKKGKRERNLRMLERQIEENENVFWAHYYIASEYYNNQNYPQALQRVNLSIISFLEQGVLPPSMVYKLKYSTLLSMGKYVEALKGIEKAILLYPDYVDLYFYKALAAYYLGRYTESISGFQKCLQLGEDNKKHLILKGVGSFQTWYYISLCEHRLNNYEKAIIAIMQSLLCSNSYQEAKHTLRTYMKEDDKLVFTCLTENFNEKDQETLIKIITEIKQ